MNSGIGSYEYHLPEYLENDWQPDEFQGTHPLIRSIKYIGQENPSQFQKSYIEKLQAFFVKELA